MDSIGRKITGIAGGRDERARPYTTKGVPKKGRLKLKLNFLTRVASDACPSATPARLEAQVILPAELCRLGQSRIPIAGQINPLPAGRKSWRNVCTP